MRNSDPTELIATEPEQTRSDVQTQCPKRAYKSRGAARKAHRHAHWRVGIYQCDVCGLYHVRNEEKR